jgi:hypothetical protein
LKKKREEEEEEEDTVCLVQEERVSLVGRGFLKGRGGGLNRQEGIPRFMNRKMCVSSRKRGFPEMEERVS